MVFNRYAKYYDVFYRGKDYKKECGYLERIFKKYLSEKPETILDLGCGTGNHAIVLAAKGYKVTGVDGSREMLRRAREKSRARRLDITWHNGKLQNFKLGKTHDAAICMFSVIDYLVKTQDLKRFLKNVFRHLKSDALFIFDFWNEAAVNRYYSPHRKKKFLLDSEVIERNSETRIFPVDRLCQVDYMCRVRGQAGVLENISEKHEVRYFSMMEIKRFLLQAGFRTLSMHPFLNAKSTIRKNTWDVTVVAKKI